MSRVESGRCQKSKAADVKAADVAQSGRCCLKRPMFVWKRPMFVRKQPMIDRKRPMCLKAADVFAKSGRCPLRTKAADVENIYFEIFRAKAADDIGPMYPKYESGRCLIFSKWKSKGESSRCTLSNKAADVWFIKMKILRQTQPMCPKSESGRCLIF